MPAYKDKKTWYVKFRYKDWRGEYVYKTKRGFKTKKEAQEWETQYKLKMSGSTEMTLKDFVARYKEELYPRIKESTTCTKDNIIDTKILPYFGDKKISEISASDIIQWQNELLKAVNPRTGQKYSRAYLKTVHAQLSTILNYAVRNYNLNQNNASKVGNMVRERDIKKRMSFWTLDDFRKFIDVMAEEPVAYYAFETLYWTGMREGELLALTLSDIDFKKSTIKIDKTYQVLRGKEVITDPKTIKSNREIRMPDFLRDELREYCDMTYCLRPNDRIFPISKTYLNNHIKKGAKEAGLKQIRVHDLRHSHISLLINMGYNAVAIAERVGHESIAITYNYAHIFPTVQSEMCNQLETIRRANQ